MVPHYHIFSVREDYDNMCLSQAGEYCAEDPDGGGEIKGADVVRETVRQLCIYELTAIADPDTSKPGVGLGNGAGSGGSVGWLCCARFLA